LLNSLGMNASRLHSCDPARSEFHVGHPATASKANNGRTTLSRQVSFRPI
jgi:hypothetical protein